MKRKHDASNDSELNQAVQPSPADDSKLDVSKTESGPSFSSLGLDTRLVQAVAKQGWLEPTFVQSKSVPVILRGRNLLCKSRTGSGKTAAYVLPVLSLMLSQKTEKNFKLSGPGPSALILVPTRELTDQVVKVVEELSAYCFKQLQAVKLSEKVAEGVQRALLANDPDVLVTTPSVAWKLVNSGALSLANLKHLVLDEADLLWEYGYEADLQNLHKSTPSAQIVMMSATMTDKSEICRNPVVLDLEDEETDGDGLTQFYVHCGEDEKWLLIYVIIKLRLIKGKIIIFVGGDVDRCYRLKLFLEQFGIRSALLNPELPLHSMMHILQQFSANIYDILIASDTQDELFVEEERTAGEGVGGAEDGADKSGDTRDKKTHAPRKKKRKIGHKDEAYGVSRGIDFKRVAAVINFDLPRSASSYTHRIGRTARAGQTGMAFSLVVPKDLYRKHVPTSIESCENDEKVLGRIIKLQEKLGRKIEPYHFDMKQVDAFRYRMQDALRAVTKVAIREARIRELRQELLASEKLKRHFEENPDELRHLRHDTELRTVRQNPHLKHVPDYLLPKEGKKALTSDEVGIVTFKKKVKDRRYVKRKPGGKSFKIGKRKGDPLKGFKGRRKAK